jgi:hypothetical protein
MSIYRTNSIIEQFRNDPRINKLRQSHETSVHIAIVVLRGKIIAQTIHAERNVLKVLGDYNKLRDADIYVMRCGKGVNAFNFINSKPCSECECFLNKCIRKYGLNKIYYTS